jgi:hypothetical protein
VCEVEFWEVFSYVLRIFLWYRMPIAHYQIGGLEVSVLNC